VPPHSGRNSEPTEGRLQPKSDDLTARELGMPDNPTYEELRRRVEELEQALLEKRARGTAQPSKESSDKPLSGRMDAVFILDDGTPPRIVDCNPAAESMFGYSRDEILNKTTEGLHIDRTAFEGFQKRLHPEIRGQGFIHLDDLRMKRRDGTFFSTEHDVAPLLNKRGERTGWVSVIRNITHLKEVEATMLESVERYRLLAENVSDVIFTRDMNLRFTYISPSVEKLTGYTVEEAMALTMEESYTPQSIQLAVQAFSEELAMEKEPRSDPSRVRTMEMEGYRKDGSTMWTEAKMSFLRDPDGRAVGILGVSRDITERKQAERAMILSEERYRSLVEDMPALVCRFLPDGTLTFVNNSYCDYFGRKREDLIGRNFFQFIPAEERREVKDGFASPTKENPVVAYEHQVIGPDGIKRWQHRIDRALFDEAGDLKEYQCLGLDVTEGKQAEEALRESEKRYRQLFNHAPAGIYEVDFLKQRFVTVNDVMCKYAGYTEKEFLSMAPEDFLSHEGKIHYAQRVRKIMAGEDVPEAVEYEIMTKKGRKLWVAVNSNPVCENGKVKGATVVVHDITGRRKTEQMLRQSEERLRSLPAELIKAQERERRRISRELHDELGQSMAILMHRVRSIEKTLHPIQPQTENDIGGAVELIEEVIEKVRKISRDLHPALLDDLGFSPALRYLAENLTEECRISVSLDISDIDALISKEAARNIYRICQEALTNVMKHAGANHVRIKTRKENGSLSLFVEDNGKGFDPLEAGTRAGVQKGLGLTVMRERAYLIGGTLEISSRPEGGGTRISLTIPLEDSGAK